MISEHKNNRGVSVQKFAILQECPPGTYSNEPGRESCTLCDFGQYQNLTGQSSCKPCGAHTTTLYPKSRSADQCVCEAGRIEDTNNSAGCVVCMKGLECPRGTTVGKLLVSNGTAEESRLLAGFNSEPNDPLTVFKCPTVGTCPGWNQSLPYLNCKTKAFVVKLRLHWSKQEIREMQVENLVTALALWVVERVLSVAKTISSRAINAWSAKLRWRSRGSWSECCSAARFFRRMCCPPTNTLIRPPQSCASLRVLECWWCCSRTWACGLAKKNSGWPGNVSVKHGKTPFKIHIRIWFEWFKTYFVSSRQKGWVFETTQVANHFGFMAWWLGRVLPLRILVPIPHRRFGAQLLYMA